MRKKCVPAKEVAVARHLAELLARLNCLDHGGQRGALRSADKAGRIRELRGRLTERQGLVLMSTIWSFTYHTIQQIMQYVLYEQSD